MSALAWIRSNTWSIVLLALYVGVSITMWVIAFNIVGDKSSAAMIGAASAISIAGAAVAGGWFTASRTSRLQQSREDRDSRRDAYVRLLGTLADYRRACIDVRDFKKISEGLRPGEDPDLTISAKAHLVAAQARVREVLLGLEQAFAAVELLAVPKVREAMASLKQEIDAADLGEAVRSFVDEARRDAGTVK